MTSTSPRFNEAAKPLGIPYDCTRHEHTRSSSRAAQIGQMKFSRFTTGTRHSNTTYGFTIQHNTRSRVATRNTRIKHHISHHSRLSPHSRDVALRDSAKQLAQRALHFSLSVAPPTPSDSLDAQLIAGPDPRAASSMAVNVWQESCACAHTPHNICLCAPPASLPSAPQDRDALSPCSQTSTFDP